MTYYNPDRITFGPEPTLYEVLIALSKTVCQLADHTEELLKVQGGGTATVRLPGTFDIQDAVSNARIIRDTLREMQQS